MSLVSFRLGNGNTGTVEIDCFTRLLNNQIYDTEEIRKAWYGNYEYVCVGPLGSSIYEPVWNAIRTTWINGKRFRVQYQPNLAYAYITDGWTL